MQAVLLDRDGVRITDHGSERAIEIDTSRCAAPTAKWSTQYPIDLIEHVLDVKGPMWVCDEIRRDEDPRYVFHELEWDIFGYVDKGAFKGARILDFGCGSGASTMILSRTLPQSRIVGVEMVREFVDLARHRAHHYGVGDRVEFVISGNPNGLPEGIGTFDYVVFSAVFEHLLPAERRTLVPAVWGALKPGGVLFLNGTPHRWFPVEQHTTGFPLLNYLPRQLVRWITCRYCPRVGKNETWEQLLRRGIRGGTRSEVMRVIAATGRRGAELRPLDPRLKDEIDLWREMSSSLRLRAPKRMFAAGARALKTLTGCSLLPSIAMAIRKA